MKKLEFFLSFFSFILLFGILTSCQKDEFPSEEIVSINDVVIRSKLAGVPTPSS